MGVDIAKIRRLRESQKLTLDAAAKKAGLANRQQWHQIEAGLRTNLTVDTLERVAKALGVKAKDLLK